MSRSRRKTPIIGIAGGSRPSEKKDKQWSNQTMRSLTKKLLAAGAEVLPEHPREVVNPWSMTKDGKTRFDPKKYPKQMRK